MASLATFATLAKLALYILQAFGWANNLSERRAGAAQSQLDAQNAEIKRVQNAADAGAASGGLPVGQADPFDEAGK